MQVETTFDLRYNIAALTIAICSEQFVLPEKAFSIIEEKVCSITDEDILDMVVMTESMTYMQIGEVYGLKWTTVYGRVRRYRDRQKKEPSDGNLKSSRY